ncbi:hypothetical protein RA277_29040, partial [Pseudomonas syringae pv. tagetis]
KVLRYKIRPSGDEIPVRLVGLFVHFGLFPNSDWLMGAIELSPRGDSSMAPMSQSLLGNRPKCTKSPTSRTGISSPLGRIL